MNTAVVLIEGEIDALCKRVPGANEAETEQLRVALSDLWSALFLIKGAME